MTSSIRSLYLLAALALAACGSAVTGPVPPANLHRGEKSLLKDHDKYH